MKLIFKKKSKKGKTFQMSADIEAQTKKAKKKYLEDIRLLLKQLRNPDLTPETILSNGQEAGDFAVEYLRKNALYNYSRRRQSINKKRGRPKKVVSIEDKPPTRTKKEKTLKQCRRDQQQ